MCHQAVTKHGPVKQMHPWTAWKGHKHYDMLGRERPKKQRNKSAAKPANFVVAPAAKGKRSSTSSLTDE